jgi:hypothetical protein
VIPIFCKLRLLLGKGHQVSYETTSKDAAVQNVI